MAQLETLGCLILLHQSLSCEPFSCCAISEGSPRLSQLYTANLLGIVWYPVGLSPTEHDVVRSAVEGCKRLLAKSIKPKDPLPVDVITRLVETLAGGPKSDLGSLRFVLLSLMSLTCL